MTTASVSRHYSVHLKASKKEEERRRPRNNWKRELKKEMWTVGFRYSWRNMEVAAELDGDKWPMLHWE